MPNVTCIIPDNSTLHMISTGEKFMWFFLYGTVAFLAVVGNSLVISIILRRQRMQTVVNFLIVNLAAADALTGLLAIPFKFQAALLQRWVLPDFMCSLIPFIEQVSLSVSVCTLCIMAVDRFLSVRLKTSKMTTSAAYSLIAATWLFSIGASVPFGYHHGMSTIYVQFNGTCLGFRGCQPPMHQEWWKMYNISLVILQYFVPLIIVNISYCWIAYKVWLTEPPNLGSDHTKRFFQSKKRVVKMLLIVVTVFTFCWLPYEIYLVLAEIKPEVNQFHYINVIFFCSHWLAMSNSCLNPIIYGAKFQKEYREVFKCFFRPCFPQSQQVQICSEELDEAKRLNDLNNSQPLIDTLNSKSPLNSKHNYRHQYIASELGRDSE